MKEKMPHSIRKYLRREKARIRRVEKDDAKQKEMIGKLYERIGLPNKISNSQ